MGILIIVFWVFFLKESLWMIWWYIWLDWGTQSLTWPSVTLGSSTCWWNWRPWCVSTQPRSHSENRTFTQILPKNMWQKDLGEGKNMGRKWPGSEEEEEREERWVSWHRRRGKLMGVDLRETVKGWKREARSHVQGEKIKQKHQV